MIEGGYTVGSNHYQAVAQGIHIPDFPTVKIRLARKGKASLQNRLFFYGKWHVFVLVNKLSWGFRSFKPSFSPFLKKGRLIKRRPKTNPIYSMKNIIKKNYRVIRSFLVPKVQAVVSRESSFPSSMELPMRY